MLARLAMLMTSGVSLVSIQRQAEIVHKFTINNFLTLNLDE